MSIKKLPPEVQNIIRTGLVITSPSQCIIELVENSLDAKSTCVAVRVDLDRFTLQVVDNGHGLTKEELDSIGDRYMTSKCHLLKDLKSNLQYYGFRGESLASLRKSCKVLMIISRHKNSELTHSKVFRVDKPTRAATIAAQNRLCPGTTVIVKDLLFNLPVRRDRIQPAIEMEDIRHALVALSIINYEVSFTLRNDVKKVVILQTREFTEPGDALKHHCAMKSNHCMVLRSASVKPFRVSAYVSRDTEQSGRFQFIFVNKRLVKNKNLYKLVTKNLSKSFYLRNIEKEGNLMNNKLREKPVFIINIQSPLGAYDITADPKKCQVEFQNWNPVIKCLEKTIKQFILSEGDLHPSAESRNEEMPEKDPGTERVDNKEDMDEYPIKSKVLCAAPVKRLVETILNKDKNIDIDLPETKLNTMNKIQGNVVDSDNDITKHRQENKIINNDRISFNQENSVHSDNDVTKQSKEVENVYNDRISLASAETVLRVVSKKVTNKNDNSRSLTSKNLQIQKVILSDSGQQSDIENPFPFKIPTEKLRARKRKLLTEHVTTETESDVSSIETTRNSAVAVQKAKNQTITSILPIASEEFFCDSIKNNVMTTQLLFNSYKVCKNRTPAQAFQINMYRSVKEDRKNNFLKYIQENSVKCVDINNDKSTYFNCFEGSQSTVPKEELLKPVTNQFGKKKLQTVEFEQLNVSSSMRQKNIQHGWKLFSPIFKHLAKKENRMEFPYKRKNYNVKFERNIVQYGKKANGKHTDTSTSNSKHNTMVNNKTDCSTKVKNITSMPPCKKGRYKRLLVQKEKRISKGKLEILKESNACIEKEISKDKDDGRHLNFRSQCELETEKSFLCNKIGKHDRNITHFSQHKQSNSLFEKSFYECKRGMKRKCFNRSNLEKNFKTHLNEPENQPPIFNFVNSKETQINSSSQIWSNLCDQNHQDATDYDNVMPVPVTPSPLPNIMTTSSQQDVFNIPTLFNCFNNSSEYDNLINDLCKLVSSIQIEDDGEVIQKHAFFIGRSFRENQRDLDISSFGFSRPNKSPCTFKADSFECFPNITMQTPSQCSSVRNKINNKTMPQVTANNSKDHMNYAIENNLFSYTNSPLQEAMVNKSPIQNVEIINDSLSNKDIEMLELNEMNETSSSLNAMDVSNLNSQNDQVSNYPLTEGIINNLVCTSDGNEVNIFQLECAENMSNYNEKKSYQQSKTLVNSGKWALEMTPNGRMIYIHPLTGMSSFQAPENSDTTFHTLNNRHWFMTKGSSPLLQINCSTDHLKQLNDTERNIIQEIVVTNVASELDTVKWKEGKVQEIEDVMGFLDAPDIILNKNSHWSLRKPCVFSSESLKNAKVLGQIDCKFIAATLQPTKETNSFLVLFDQHAVDERICLEHLISKYKESDGQLITQSLNPCVEVILHEHERSMITELQPRLLKLGLCLKVEANKVFVTGIPLCLFNRVIKQNGEQLLKTRLSTFVKELIISAGDLHGILPSLPQCLSDIINSEACRGAIKFGDSLTVDKCRHMMAKLALCDMPFQCAHGRPVLTLLMELVEPPAVKDPLNLRRLTREQPFLEDNSGLP